MTELLPCLMLYVEFHSNNVNHVVVNLGRCECCSGLSKMADFRTVLLSCDASPPQPRSRATFGSYKIKTSFIQAPWSPPCMFNQALQPIVIRSDLTKAIEIEGDI